MRSFTILPPRSIAVPFGYDVRLGAILATNTTSVSVYSVGLYYYRSEGVGDREEAGGLRGRGRRGSDSFCSRH